jgi:hypothetical protein
MVVDQTVQNCYRESGVSRQAMIREFPVERHFEGVFDIGVISNLLCGMMEVAIDERMDIVTVWRHDWFAKVFLCKLLNSCDVLVFRTTISRRVQRCC